MDSHKSKSQVRSIRCTCDNYIRLANASQNASVQLCPFTFIPLHSRPPESPHHGKRNFGTRLFSFILLSTSLILKMSEPASTTTLNEASSIEEALEHAKRAFALKKYEQAVQHYASALEKM